MPPHAAIKLLFVKQKNQAFAKKSKKIQLARPSVHRSHSPIASRNMFAVGNKSPQETKGNQRFLIVSSQPSKFT
jgi:hypothetical protein